MLKEGHYDKSFNLILALIDVIGICIAFFIAYYLRFDQLGQIPQEFLLFLLLTSLLWSIISFYNEIYQLSKLRSLILSIRNLVYISLIHLLLISLSFVSLKVQDTYTFPRLFLLYFYATLFAGLFAIRTFYYVVIKIYYKDDKFNVIPVVIIGAGKTAKRLYHGFKQEIIKGSSYKILGFFENNFDKEIDTELRLGNLEEVKEFCLSHKISEIYYAKPLTDSKVIEDLTGFADKNFIYLRFVPDFQGLEKSRFTISFLDSVPIIEYTKTPLGSFINQKLKRIFDILFATGVVFFIYPIVFPLISLLIKLESKGPVLFKQLRPGKGNELFECYKFRTMRVNNSTEKQAVKNDPRITRIGSFLRKTSLDEFPQFLNVLQGKMSIVGPRPNMISQLEFYSKEIDKYRFRHFITPGITGWAQVNGLRGETEEIELMRKRIEYDAWYIENWSISLDFKIIFLTVFKLLVGDKRAY